MALWFETAVRYDKMMENGIVKRVTERYLVDALSFAEAEARITEGQSPYISGWFTVSVARKTKIAEIFGADTERYWLAKVAFITIDEKTAQEKRSISHILVGAPNFSEAYDNFMDGMKDTMADFELISLAESPILEVYPARVGN